MSTWLCKETGGSPPHLCSGKCGDGVLTDAETCDDGSDDQEGCNSTCSGVEVGWTCEYQQGKPDAVCKEVCGDGLVVGSEICDDGS